MILTWEQFEELITAEMRRIYSGTTIDHAMNPILTGEKENAANSFSCR